MESKEVNDELAAYVQRLEQRTGQRWQTDGAYYTGSYHRAVVRSEAGETRYLWYDWDRWRWDGHRDRSKKVA